MARKTATVTITDEGRDRGRTYHIKELPASQVEKWAARAFLALAKSGVDLPEDAQNSGIAGFAVMGMMALKGLAWEDAEPLLDEMMSCVTFQPDLKNPNTTRPIMEDDVEEIATRMKLRMEVFALHTGFSIPGVTQKALSR